jgi:hypothetical protein
MRQERVYTLTFYFWPKTKTLTSVNPIKKAKIKAGTIKRIIPILPINSFPDSKL